jgi:hypothetical protein
MNSSINVVVVIVTAAVAFVVVVCKTLGIFRDFERCATAVVRIIFCIYKFQLQKQALLTVMFCMI